MALRVLGMIYSCFLLVLLIRLYNAQGNDCESAGRRGPGCEQGDFDGWDVEVSDKLQDDGRLPGVSSHDKKEKYYLNTTEWCDSIRPCPLHGGTTDASHNAEKSGEVLKRDSSWTSGAVSSSSLTSGDVWVAYTLPHKALAVGFLMFKPSEDIKNIRFEGSVDGNSWENIELQEDNLGKDLWTYKVIHSQTSGVRAFLSFRLSVVATKWTEAGSDSGSISVGNLQICFIDKFDDTNDNPYVASPPFIPDPNAGCFASSRWGRNWHEDYAFTGPSRAWCSKYVYATRGVLNEPQHVGYTFPVARIVRKIRLMGSYQARWMKHHPKSFLFQGSNDKQSWTTLLSATLPTLRSISRTEELEIPEENLKPYLHYRFYITKTGWSVIGYPGGYIIMRAVRLC